MTDEGFREIQLSGKQLVFLFMAATVVSVAIFLFGVFVGRDVRPDPALATEAAKAEIAADPAGTPSEPSTPFSAAPGVSAPPAGSGAPPAPAEELTYPDRLQRARPPQETLKPAPAIPDPLPPQPAGRTAATTKPAPPSPSRTPAALATPSDPAGPGYAVQVAAYGDRRQADSLAKQLIAKGYPAYVLDPVKGTPTQLHRVRVGKYKTAKEAQEVSKRLETLEQFDPWIAR